MSLIGQLIEAQNRRRNAMATYQSNLGTTWTATSNITNSVINASYDRLINQQAAQASALAYQNAFAPGQAFYIRNPFEPATVQEKVNPKLKEYSEESFDKVDVDTLVKEILNSAVKCPAEDIKSRVLAQIA